MSFLFIVGCGKGPSPFAELQCGVSGANDFTFAAFGATAFSDYIVSVTYADNDGTRVPYTGVEISILSPTSNWLPCVGDQCQGVPEQPGGPVRNLTAKGNDNGIVQFQALVEGSDISVTIPIYVENFTSATCQIPLVIAVEIP